MNDFDRDFEDFMGYMLTHPEDDPFTSLPKNNYTQSENYYTEDYLELDLELERESEREWEREREQESQSTCSVRKDLSNVRGKKWTGEEKFGVFIGFAFILGIIVLLAWISPGLCGLVISIGLILIFGGNAGKR